MRSMCCAIAKAAVGVPSEGRPAKLSHPARQEVAPPHRHGSTRGDEQRMGHRADRPSLANSLYERTRLVSRTWGALFAVAALGCLLGYAIKVGRRTGGPLCADREGPPPDERRR